MNMHFLHVMFRVYIACPRLISLLTKINKPHIGANKGYYVYVFYVKRWLLRSYRRVQVNSVQYHEYTTPVLLSLRSCKHEQRFQPLSPSRATMKMHLKQPLTTVGALPTQVASIHANFHTGESSTNEKGYSIVSDCAYSRSRDCRAIHGLTKPSGKCCLAVDKQKRRNSPSPCLH